MAQAFSYDFSSSEAPEHAQAQLRARLTQQLGSAGMRLAKQTPSSLSYRPKWHPILIGTLIWLSRELGGERVVMTFAPEGGGTRLTVSGKVSGKAELVADREFWTGALSTD